MSAGLDAFLRAVADGDLQTVRAAIVHEPELADRPGPHPFWGGRPTAVTVAAERGRLDVLRFLLEYGASPDAPRAEYDGWAPLLCAIVKRHPAAASLLLEHGATVDAFAAAALGDATRLRAILGDDPESVSRTGPNRATPLHFAATPEIAAILIEAGADPAAVDQYDLTPFRAAAYAGVRRRDVARFLAAHSPPPDIFIGTALGDARAVGELLDRDPTLVSARDRALGPANARGGTPLHVAAALGEVAVARLLIECGAAPDARSTEGHTPLHYAAGNGHGAMAKMLLESGATRTATDAQHHATPADWADFFGHTAHATTLRT